MVFCISAAVLTTISCFVSSLVNSSIVFFMPLPRAPVITGTKVTVSRSSFSHLKSKLSMSRKLISPFRINILLHGTSHVADPNLLLVFQDKFHLIVLQNHSSLPSLFVPHCVSSNQLMFFRPSDCEYHQRCVSLNIHY